MKLPEESVVISLLRIILTVAIAGTIAILILSFLATRVNAQIYGWVIEWEPNPEARFYHIYRSDNADSGFSIVAQVEFPNYYDTTIVTQERFYYRVTAVDSNYLESDFSNVVSGMEINLSEGEPVDRVFDYVGDNLLIVYPPPACEIQVVNWAFLNSVDFIGIQCVDALPFYGALSIEVPE